ncbi:MAG: hypothetical protein FIB08_00415 [Candidatus Methanoperedens sp.]|nr:hypothetical protein [Candidatus Methanoperedens sp.]
MEKEQYLKIALEKLSTVFSETGAKATIDVMAKLKLTSIADVDKNLINELNSILYNRVKVLKGENMAAQFIKSINAACG